MDDDKEDELAVLREKQKLRIEFWKSIVSLVLLALCGLTVVGVPVCERILKVAAIMQGWPQPPSGDFWMSFNSVVGSLAILCWGFPYVIPIIREVKDIFYPVAPEPHVIEVDDDETETTESDSVS